MNKFNVEDAQRFYRWLNHQPDEFTELRIIPWPSTGKIKRYWVQNEKDFIKWCRKWSGKKQVYVGINPRKHKGGEAKDVTRVVGIPFDVDSPHPKKQAATEEELAQAKERMIALNSWIRIQGYKLPLIAMSGNGYHLIQKVDLPVDDTLPSKLEAYFHEVPIADMDAIFDLPRIIKVPGTMSVKGNPTEERPRRLTHIITEGDPDADETLAAHIQTLEPYTPTAEPYVPTPTGTPKTGEKIKTIGLKPCFKRFAEEGGFLSNVRSEDHLLRLALVTEAHAKGYSRNQIIDLFRNSGDFNIKETQKQVDHQLGKLAVEGTKNKVWSCLAIHKHQGCLGETCPRYKKNVAKHLSKQKIEERPPWFYVQRITHDGEVIWGFKVDVYGAHLLKKHHWIATSEKSDIWKYNPDKGIWEPNGKEKLQEITKHALLELYNSHTVNEVARYVRYSSYQPTEILGAPPNKIVVKNGVLNIETRKLTAFTPDLHAITALPVKYNPDAKCPKIEKFLSEVMLSSDIMKIYDYTGYCLYKEYPIARIIILTGTGRNGKSRLLKLISTFLGNKNVSSVTLQSLNDNDFRAAQLYGKLANICGDLPKKTIKDPGMIKTLTGEDPLTAEHKYKDPFQFYNHAKMIFSANELPKTYDDTDAFYRRMVTIDFPNIFPADDPKTDPKIIEKIATPEEFSGLLNKALDGLDRLMKQGHLTNEKTIEERKIEYIRKSNKIQYFAIKYVKKDLDNWISKAQLYNYFVAMCEQMNVIPDSNTWFSREVRRYLPYTREGDERVNKVKTKVWRGIRVKIGELADLGAKLGRNGRNGRNGISYYCRQQERHGLIESIYSKGEEDTVPAVPTVPKVKENTDLIDSKEEKEEPK